MDGVGDDSFGLVMGEAVSERLVPLRLIDRGVDVEVGGLGEVTSVTRCRRLRGLEDVVA